MGESTVAEKPGLTGTEVPPGSQGDDQSAIACDLTAIAAEQRAAHEILVERLWFDAAQEILELPDGYALRFSAGEYPAIAAFIDNERLCCPFFDFTLEVTPAGGPLWLRLTGGEGVKDFLSLMLNR